jgi:hypothetical protein
MPSDPLNPLQRLAEIAVDRGIYGARLHDLADTAKPNLEAMSKSKRAALLDACRDLSLRISTLDAEECALREDGDIDEKLTSHLAGHERQIYDDELKRLRRDQVDALTRTLKLMPAPKWPDLAHALRPRRGHRSPRPLVQRRSRSTSRRAPPAKAAARLSGDDDPPHLGALAGALLALAARAKGWRT